MSLKKNMGEVLSAQGKEMREIQSNLATLSAQMAAMMEEVKTNRVSGYKAPSQSPSPKTWPKDPEKLRLPEGWVAAVGVHPKNTGDFGDCYFDRLSRLMDSPAVTALGEVALDCSKGAKLFAVQYSTLRWVLALARPYMPLVLHVRVSEEDPQATDALYRRV
jgi:Tat protein secretion system quality control protein TatD with DNase activity